MKKKESQYKKPDLDRCKLYMYRKKERKKKISDAYLSFDSK